MRTSVEIKRPVVTFMFVALALGISLANAHESCGSGTPLFQSLKADNVISFQSRSKVLIESSFSRLSLSKETRSYQVSLHPETMDRKGFRGERDNKAFAVIKQGLVLLPPQDLAQATGAVYFDTGLTAVQFQKEGPVTKALRVDSIRGETPDTLTSYDHGTGVIKFFEKESGRVIFQLSMFDIEKKFGVVLASSSPVEIVLDQKARAVRFGLQGPYYDGLNTSPRIATLFISDRDWAKKEISKDSRLEIKDIPNDENFHFGVPGAFSPNGHYVFLNGTRDLDPALMLIRSQSLGSRGSIEDRVVPFQVNSNLRSRLTFLAGLKDLAQQTGRLDPYFSPNSEALVVAASAFGRGFTQTRVLVYSTQTGRTLGQGLRMTGEFGSGNFSPDGSVIAVPRLSKDKTEIEIVDLKTGVHRVIPFESQELQSLLSPPESKVVSLREYREPQKQIVSSGFIRVGDQWAFGIFVNDQVFLKEWRSNQEF